MADYFDSGRIEAFSDGVFGIAATLLVLEIAVPAASFDDLWDGIVDQWPSYLAYGTSFWTIGGLWVLHHGIFRRLRYADLHLMRMNLFLLFVVAFLPFPTHLMAEAIKSASAERVAVLFYGATLLLISATIAVIARYAAREGRAAARGRREVRDAHHRDPGAAQPRFQRSAGRPRDRRPADCGDRAVRGLAVRRAPA